MKPNHAKKLCLSKLIIKRNLFLIAIFAAFILCPSGIGIATANNLDEAPATTSSDTIIDDNLNSKPELINNDLINMQETTPSTSYSDQSYYLGFTAVGKSSQVAICKQEVLGLPERIFYYSDDNCSSWKEYKADNFIDIPVNSTVYFKGNNPEGINETNSDFYHFSFMEGTSISVTGNVLSLLGEESDIHGVIPPSSTHCFYMLFFECKEIKYVTNDLLRTSTLSQMCYMDMFYSCSGLESVPEGFLPVEDLAEGCYWSMFVNCNGLKSVPENLLPSKKLAPGCYCCMFEECNNLEKAPTLPAETLENDSYDRMFVNCEKLNYFNVGLTQWDWHNSWNWLNGVSADGDFYCKNCLEQPETRSADTVPSTWKIIPENYMTCSTDSNSAMLSYSLNFSNAKDCNLYYSKDLISWCRIDTSAVVTKQDISSISTLEHLYMYGGNSEGLNSDTFVFNLLCEENLSINGSAMALIGADEDTIPNPYCFNSLFKGCTGLTQGPSLPATNLKEYCYTNMFEGCTNLNKGPYLPATELKDSCYMEMFNGCKSMDALKVDFADWFEDARYYSFNNQPTKNWLQNTNSETNADKEFYCPADLDTESSQDESHVPTWWTVQKDEVINAEVVGVTKTYDGNAYSISVDIKTSGEGFVIKYIYEGAESDSNPSFRDVGTYTVGVKITKNNYQPFEGSADVVINKNTSGQMTIGNYTKTYGDDDPNFEVQASGFVGDYKPVEGQDFVVLRDPGENVKAPGGWYTIHAYWINNNSNFEVEPAEGKLTITKANATLVAEEKSKLDNAGDPAFTAHMSGLVHGGDVLDSSHYKIDKQIIGDGNIYLVPSLTSTGEEAFLRNYNLDYQSAVFTIYSNESKVIVVPEYINVPGEIKVIDKTQASTDNAQGKNSTNDKPLNNSKSNQESNNFVISNLALIISLVVNVLLLAAGVVFFLKFKKRIFK